MTRSLPWKKTSGSTTSKDKGKSRARESDSEASDSNQSHSSQQKRKRTDRDDSDYQDDDNWRMTESELAATAKLWTQNLHQQAYEKLFHVQQK